MSCTHALTVQHSIAVIVQLPVYFIGFIIQVIAQFLFFRADQSPVRREPKISIMIWQKFKNGIFRQIVPEPDVLEFAVFKTGNSRLGCEPDYFFRIFITAKNTYGRQSRLIVIISRIPIWIDHYNPIIERGYQPTSVVQFPYRTNVIRTKIDFWKIQ